jgi:hypothetical protein
MIFLETENDILNHDKKKPFTLVKIINGKLIPSKIDPATLSTKLRKFEYELEESSLWELTAWSCEWRVNHLSYHVVSTAYEPENIVSKFVKVLNRVMQTEAAIELGLSGYFTLTIETDEEPLVTRILVKEGVVSYEQAEYVWPSERTTADGQS